MYRYLQKGTIAVTTNTKAPYIETVRKLYLKLCHRLLKQTSEMKYITEINSTQKDNVKDIDVVMPICNLLKYNDNYSKTRGTL